MLISYGIILVYSRCKSLNMSKVSIIIPVYNAGKFIGRCISSLLSQTHKNWEAICVDDGSRDNSAAVIREYANKDSRIKLICQENAGVSIARNNALKLVEGTFLTFVDSDDFLHPQTLEISVKLAEQDSSDLVAYTYSRSYRTNLIIRHALHISDSKKQKFKMWNIDEIDRMVTDNIFDWVAESLSKTNIDKKWAVKHCQPWRCLYRTDRVRNVEFIQGIIYEDFPWWGEVLLNVRRATIINLPLYFYYPNQGSYIFSSGQEYRIESLKIAIDAAEKVYKEKATPEQMEIWESRFIEPFRNKLQKKMKNYE